MSALAQLEAWAAPRRAALQSYLDGLFADARPAVFGEMCRYPLQTGGKRIRPLFLFAAYEACGGEDFEAVLPLAAAIELVHTYSLVHDDLPCMDDDAERRGRPTVHVAFREDAAVLVGDALLTEAFRQVVLCTELDRARVGDVVALLSDYAGYLGMIGGQALDIGLGGRVGDLDGVVEVHTLKTGRLIWGSVRMGVMAAGSPPELAEALDAYARDLGLAFQLADDVLDADEDEGDDGPPSFVRLLGVDETKRRARQLADAALTAIDGLDHPALATLATFTVERSL